MNLNLNLNKGERVRLCKNVRGKHFGRKNVKVKNVRGKNVRGTVTLT